MRRTTSMGGQRKSSESSVASKKIDTKTPVWNEDLDEWKDVDALPDLLKKLKIAAKPKVPPKKKKPAPAKAPAAKKLGLGAPKLSNTALKSRKIHKHGLASTGNTGGWEERRTVDGVPYYCNIVTEELAWEKPDALKSAAELETDAGEWFWVRDEKEAWLPGRVTKTQADGSVVVDVRGRGKKTIKKSKDEPLWSLQKTSLQRLTEDLVMLDDLNEAQIIYNLRERYRQDKIYTWVGASKSVLVSVNPFKMLPIYTPQIIQDYYEPRPNRKTPPRPLPLQMRVFERCSWMNSIRRYSSVVNLVRERRRLQSNAFPSLPTLQAQRTTSSREFSWPIQF